MKKIVFNDVNDAFFKRILNRRLMGRDWRCSGGKLVWWVMKGPNVVSICTDGDRNRTALAKEIVSLRGTSAEDLADAIIGWLLSLTRETA